MLSAFVLKIFKMGEVTEMILDGILCQVCGCFVNKEIQGYPVTCEDCKKADDDGAE